MRFSNMSKLAEYRHEIRALDAQEGGGFLISYPDFSECILDGATEEEALKNGEDALQATIIALLSKGFPVPAPKDGISI